MPSSEHSWRNRPQGLSRLTLVYGLSSPPGGAKGGEGEEKIIGFIKAL